MKKTKTAFFGGSFDPPHCGHVMVVSYVLSCTECEEVFVVPCFEHAFGKPLSPFDARLEMAKTAFSMFQDKVKVLDIEAHLPTPSYTVQTLQALVQTYPDREFFLVVGSDILMEIEKWRDFSRIESMASLLVLRRAGSEDIGGSGPVFPDVSSTKIRMMVSRGENVSDLVPKGVIKIIRKRGLYAN
jgi:nicotinate-nucleotide adenylyltransferase